ncbi:MAG: type II toxin-antitoxin system HicA family toxin [SAR202 cluster bacterium]|nr:type II toxin-antitoxin system HicA family toxin [SAR202 cluster bacterium]
MPRLPRVTGREVVQALERASFRVVRQRGSHLFLRHEDGRSTVVPVHAREVLGPGLLSKILRDVDMTGLEFQRLLSDR